MTLFALNFDMKDTLKPVEQPVINLTDKAAVTFNDFITFLGDSTEYGIAGIGKISSDTMSTLQFTIFISAVLGLYLFSKNNSEDLSKILSVPANAITSTVSGLGSLAGNVAGGIAKAVI
jgi:hypothetical protein